MLEEAFSKTSMLTHVVVLHAPQVQGVNFQRLDLEFLHPFATSKLETFW